MKMVIPSKLLQKKNEDAPPLMLDNIARSDSADKTAQRCPRTVAQTRQRPAGPQPGVVVKPQWSFARLIESYDTYRFHQKYSCNASDELKHHYTITF